MIVCGAKDVIAQPPHSAHKWPPFVYLLILFMFKICHIVISMGKEGSIILVLACIQQINFAKCEE